MTEKRKRRSTCMQSSRSCRIVRELRIYEIKHVQSDKPLSEITKMAEKKKQL